MILLFGAFIAGILTILAPCILPLLPVVIGGSVTGDVKNYRRPVIIAASLAMSMLLFTLLLKATTVLINVPPYLFTTISGVIVIVLGVFILFPHLYSLVVTKLGIEQKSQSALSQTAGKKTDLGAILTGAALGPVFSSCSPVYAYILATILPVNFSQAIIYMLSYILGLSLMLLLIGYFGQKIIRRIKWAANPRGAFQRTLAVLFIIVGLLIITGYDKKFQTWVSANTPFSFDAISANLLPQGNQVASGQEELNVQSYPAPELAGLQEWINSQPTTLKALRGKVVLIDFWTYSCINCIRSIPYVESWYEKYKEAGFVVLGVHAPEFAFERKAENVRQAVQEAKITYPVALDNDFSTWNNFENQYWPAHYLIDAKGQVRRVHYGEGEYQQTEAAIRLLLTDAGATLSSDMATTGKAEVPVHASQTPETYLGTKRASNYVGSPALGAASTSTFSFGNLTSDHWSLQGKWTVGEQSIIAGLNARLKFKVSAKETYLVMGSTNVAQVQILLDGKPVSQTGSAGSDVSESSVTVQDYKLYRLVSHKAFTAESLIELVVPNGVELNAFTFGGQ